MIRFAWMPRDCSIRTIRQIRLGDVVPRAHRVAAVDRDAAHWRMWKHEPNRKRLWKLALLYNGNEIVALGTEAVQDDNRRMGIGPRLELDAGKNRGCHHISDEG